MRLLCGTDVGAIISNLLPIPSRRRIKFPKWWIAKELPHFISVTMFSIRHYNLGGVGKQVKSRKLCLAIRPLADDFITYSQANPWGAVSYSGGSEG